jgi:hypothetical protein
MSKKAATKTAAEKITAVKKGEVYENKHHDLIEVTNGRLKDEGDLGMSFEGLTITFDAQTKTGVRDKNAERFYIDELVRKLTKTDFEEWVDAGRREAEAAEVSGEPAPTPTSKGKKGTKPAAKPKAKPEQPAKTDGKMSALDAAAKVLVEAGEPMTTKAMIEAMATKGYWTSPGGKTPHATLYSAILREINTKGTESRFTKTDRGHFTAK